MDALWDRIIVSVLEGIGAMVRVPGLQVTWRMAGVRHYAFIVRWNAGT